MGDRVELIAAINDDWLEGRLNSKQGLFPTAFVKVHSNTLIVNGYHNFKYTDIIK